MEYPRIAHLFAGCRSSEGRGKLANTFLGFDTVRTDPETR